MSTVTKVDSTEFDGIVDTRSGLVMLSANFAIAGTSTDGTQLKNGTTSAYSAVGTFTWLGLIVEVMPSTTTVGTFRFGSSTGGGFDITFSDANFPGFVDAVSGGNVAASLDYTVMPSTVGTRKIIALPHRTVTTGNFPIIAVNNTTGSGIFLNFTIIGRDN